MHDENSNNQYSDLRIKLFEALYKFQCKHKQIALFKDDIVSLKEVCNKNNYRRELAIIEYLENKDQKIRPIDILKIYQCLFIIIQ